MGRMAATARLITLLWSDELLEEAKRSLVAGKGLAPDIAHLWVGRRTVRTSAKSSIWNSQSRNSCGARARSRRTRRW